MISQKYKHTDTTRIGDTIIFVCATVMAIVSGATAIYVTGTLAAMYIPLFLSYDLLWGKLSVGLSVLGIVSWIMFCLFVIIAVYLRKALDDVAKKMKSDPGM